MGWSGAENDPAGLKEGKKKRRKGLFNPDCHGLRDAKLRLELRLAGVNRSKVRKALSCWNRREGHDALSRHAPVPPLCTVSYPLLYSGESNHTNEEKIKEVDRPKI